MAFLFEYLNYCIKNISKILLELYKKNIIKWCILMYFYHVYGRIKRKTKRGKNEVKENIHIWIQIFCR